MILQNVKLNWCKLLGEPRLNYNEDGKEWTVDVVLNDEHLKLLEKENLGDYLRENNDGQTFFKYRRNAEKPDGSANMRVGIVDRFGKPWDEERLIGNGSTADVQVIFNEMKRGKNKGKFKPVLLKVKVNEVVEYSAGDDFSFDTAAPAASATTEEAPW